MDSKSSNEVRMDLQNLMSCIQCHDHTNQVEVILETFNTIVQICSNESKGKDAFREEGGLEFLMEFLSSTGSTVLLEHSLKTLAFTIDGNVPNQMHMTKDHVFEIIKAVLQKENFHGTIHKNALILLSSVMYQNNAAQILLYETGIIQDLVNFYKYIFPSLSSNSSYSIPNMEEESVELWLCLNSTLCFAVNNPHNEKNQEICSVLFSPSLSVLETSLNNRILTSVSSFLSTCISDNVRNQDYFAGCDGLLTLKRCFQKYLDLLLLDAKECNSIVGKGTLLILNSLIGIISAAVTNHEKNAYLIGKIGLFSLMIKLLFTDLLDLQLKIRLYLSLGHCVDASCSNKSFILETENFDVLLKKDLESDHDELTSACSYLLQVFMLETGNKEKPDSYGEPFLKDERRKLVLSRSVPEQHLSNKVPEIEVIKNRSHSNVAGSLPNFTPTELPDIKMYLLAKTQGSSMKNFETSDTKGNNHVTSRGTKKLPLEFHTLPHSPYPSNHSMQSTISVFDSPSELSFSPSHVSNYKRNKSTSLFESSRKKLKTKHKNSTKSIKSSSVTSCSLENHSHKIQSSLKGLDELKESIQDLNNSFSQIFSNISNLGNLTSNMNLFENTTPSELAVNSNMPRNKHGLSDVTNTYLRGPQYSPFPRHSGTAKTPPTVLLKKGGLSASKFISDERENCISQDSTPKSDNYLQNFIRNRNKSVTCFDGDFKRPLAQCSRSNFHNSLDFSGNSTRSQEFTFKPSMLAPSCNKVDSSNPLPSLFDEKSKTPEKNCDSNFVKVIDFPWKTCDHGLISSFEMLQVVPIEDEDEY